VQTREVRAFSDRSRGAFTVPVELYDERVTTKLAAPDGDGRFSEDSRAAAHLLSGWLDAERTLADPPGE
jgi:putative Holliday junction resolvase